ncbi:hypothetical protein FHU41_002343 [Psychromicrobium silvestre]|uniref:Uncharacterized protein n=1 Tax=Psychromicrobium silvestre TaxID=1645614 RepID=A0A7Y9S7J2_9MICC|nr:hypothetical protein [Psychromicrobium silvestre]NYE96093.1 hypothetical protein [Psychromicrobium silvestre]
MTPPTFSGTSRVGQRVTAAILGFVLAPLGLWLLAAGGTETYRMFLLQFKTFSPQALPYLLMILLGAMLLAGICYLASLSSLAPALAALWLLPSVVAMFLPASQASMAQLFRALKLYTPALDMLLTGRTGSLGLVFIFLAIAAAILRRRGFGTGFGWLAAILGVLLFSGGLLLSDIGSWQGYVATMINGNLKAPSVLNTITVLGGLVLIALAFATAVRSAAGLIITGVLWLLVGGWYVLASGIRKFPRPPHFGQTVDPALYTQAVTGLLFTLSLTLIASGAALWTIRTRARRRLAASPS